jgi:hypothetical protein
MIRDLPEAQPKQSVYQSQQQCGLFEDARTVRSQDQKLVAHNLRITVLAATVTVANDPYYSRP